MTQNATSAVTAANPPQKITATVSIPVDITAYAEDNGMTVAEALECLLADMAAHLNNAFQGVAIKDYIGGARTTTKAKLKTGEIVQHTCIND